MALRKRMLLGLVPMLTLVVFAPPAHADTLGQTVSFRANTEYDAQSAQYFSASLQSISDRAYFYVDERYWSTLTYEQREAYRHLLGDVGREFDTVIYPRVTGFLATENSPGVDNDPRITIAVGNMKSGLGGYFMSLNGYG